MTEAGSDLERLPPVGAAAGGPLPLAYEDGPRVRSVRAAASRRRVRRYGPGVLAVVLAAVLLFLLFGRPALARYRFRAEAVRAMRAAAAAGAGGPTLAGPRGAAWGNADGSWVVIRYDFAPPGDQPVWHAAVALDSGGNWYASGRDFGAYFGQNLAPSPHAPYAAADLAGARQRLAELGFRPIRP